MPRYRKIDLRTWADAKFTRLSKLPPCGQGLWLYLLTGPFTGPVPGLFKAGRMAMAEDLGWSSEEFDRCFAEIEAQGMVRADWASRVVWIPKAILYNFPTSPNVVTSWGEEVALIPDCTLKREALDALRVALSAGHANFVQAFDALFSPILPASEPALLPDDEQGPASSKPSSKAFGKPSRKPLPKPSNTPSPIQEQEQEFNPPLPPLGGCEGGPDKPAPECEDVDPVETVMSACQKHLGQTPSIPKAESLATAMLRAIPADADLEQIANGFFAAVARASPKNLWGYVHRVVEDPIAFTREHGGSNGSNGSRRQTDEEYERMKAETRRINLERRRQLEAIAAEWQQ